MCVKRNAESQILNGNKTKQCISEMKVDIKFCCRTFSVVTLPLFFRFGRGGEGSRPGSGLEFFSTSPRPDSLWVRRSLLSKV